MCSRLSKLPTPFSKNSSRVHKKGSWSVVTFRKAVGDLGRRLHTFEGGYTFTTIPEPVSSWSALLYESSVTKFQLVPFSYGKSYFKYQPCCATRKCEPIFNIFCIWTTLMNDNTKLSPRFHISKLRFLTSTDIGVLISKSARKYLKNYWNQLYFAYFSAGHSDQGGLLW